MSEPSTTTPADEIKAEDLKQEVERLNRIVHDLLLIGLGISTTLMVIGIVLQIVSGDPLPQVMIPPHMIFTDIMAGLPDGFFTLGLMMLIATPILRVAGSVIIYAYERDWRYTLVTGVVLTIVILSIILGRE